jgi:hypothetical protein
VPARYLALRWENWRYRFTGVPSSEGTIDVSVNQGGGQIEFEDEDPAIHRTFEASVGQAGAQCRMGAYHPFCTQKTESPR